MAFTYRLEKVLNFRIQKRDEQLDVVKLAEEEVRRIEGEIQKTYKEIDELKISMRTADPMMFASYDRFIDHKHKELEELEVQKKEAIEVVNLEKEKLFELEKAVNVLDKHKEKALEEYKHEEKKKEMKKLDEIAGQKHVVKMQLKAAEQQEEDYLEELNKEGDDYEY